MQVTDQLASQVAACLGRDRLRVEPSQGGATNLAFQVFDDTDAGAGPIAFLLCEGGDDRIGGDRYGLLHEANILRAAAELGFPVPEVLGTLTSPPGIVMALVEGTSRPDAAVTEAVANEYMSLVARLHQTDVAAFPLRSFASVTEAVRDDLAWWSRLAVQRGVIDDPLIRLGRVVLSATLPAEDGPPSVIHGDVGAGNFMVDQQRVAAMLDWELTHVGDPHEDMAWLWMRGAHTEFGSPSDRFAEYESAAGTTLEGGRLDWHLAFVMWKSCIATLAMLRRPPDRSTLVRAVVMLTYGALLGAQLVRLLGGRVELLTLEPVREENMATKLSERTLGEEGRSSESRIILEYLRDSASQAAWERDSLEKDCGLHLGLRPEESVDRIDTAQGSELLGLAIVIARAADRSARAMPKAVRRIQRAQSIGLGVA
jgi:aminoglycoside phosphotransferase (APT) family kinase protein